MANKAELIAEQLLNGNINKKQWGSVMYNVLVEGLAGDGEKDDTAKLQALIDKAISEGRKSIFFPHGTYYVTALTNAEQVVFFGDNASFVGGYAGVINQLGHDPNARSISKDRFNVLARYPTQEKAITIIGDSISNGSNATDFQNNAWGGIVKKAINNNFANKNYGFESFGLDATKNNYQVLSTFNFSSSLDASYYAGVVATSTIFDAYIMTKFTGKDLKLVYAGRADGGILNVTVDGVAWGTIDTSLIGTYPNGSISPTITTSAWGEHTVIFRKADTNPTDLIGVMFYEDSSVIQPIVHNVSRSGICLSDIADNLLDEYTSGGMVILALGVNDYGLGKPINTFKAKLERVASNVKAQDGSLIIVDFLFNSGNDNQYKKAIRELAQKYPLFDYIDFARIWFGDAAKNINAGLLDADGLHPTNHGHEQISQVMLSHMNLPYSKATAKFVPDASFMPLTTANGWTAWGDSFELPGCRLYQDGKVKLRGVLKAGTIAVGTIIAYLPTGRRPRKDRVFAISSNAVAAELKISAADGSIFISSTTVNAFLSLDNIEFEID